MSFVLSECQMKKRILSQSQMSLQSKNVERKRSEAVFLRFKFDIYDFIFFKLSIYLKNDFVIYRVL